MHDFTVACMLRRNTVDRATEKVDDEGGKGNRLGEERV